MSGETWTEYTLQFEHGGFGLPIDSRDKAEQMCESANSWGQRCTIVGRTVTATPWLPVDDTAVKP